MKSLICAFIFFLSSSAFAQKTLTVLTGKPVCEVSPTMWGIFFEDINFGADGGLYAELVKNRSFEFPMPMTGWRELKGGGSGKILFINDGAKPQNPRYAELSVDKGRYGLSNEGFRGMGIHKDETYDCSIWMRKKEGDVALSVSLINQAGSIVANEKISGMSADWKEYKVSFTAKDSASHGRLELLFEGKGTVDMDMVSVFPKHTWKGRPGGLRADLVQMLADMKPGFIRFPGGCIVEGRDLTNRYQWKNTVGPVNERKLLMNRWNVEFPRRSAPDYYQTFGLGFYEYFRLAEDIGAAPLPILNCGMSCQYNSNEVVPMNELDPFIQDAIDLVEFANGDTNTKWGRLRADMGHPARFNLQYLGIGNEQWEEQYIERYTEFEKVLRERCPGIKLVAAAGPAPEGSRFDYAWKELRALNADLIDEHYYQQPDWFFKQANRYDAYDRKGPKVFAGEYAAHGPEDPKAESKNTWISALAEAAFMTGLERNADVVRMASYAPLFAHVDAWQWRPDLIWFDNYRSVATPNYYVQQLFSVNKGTEVVQVLENGHVVSGKDSVYASAVIDQQSHEVIIKLVNSASASLAYDLLIQGKKIASPGELTTLSCPEKLSFNTLDEPDKIRPVKKTVTSKKNRVSLLLAPLSVNVIKIRMSN